MASLLREARLRVDSQARVDTRQVGRAAASLMVVLLLGDTQRAGIRPVDTLRAGSLRVAHLPDSQ